jgi:hypothetical protein
LWPPITNGTSSIPDFLIQFIPGFLVSRLCCLPFSLLPGRASARAAKHPIRNILLGGAAGAFGGLKDGLPKLKDFPAAIGGSGETLPE